MWERIKRIARVTERGVLVFPLVVVFITTATFWFGGVCAPWQWWAGFVGAVAAMSLMPGTWRNRLAGIGGFLLFLALSWVLIGALATNEYDAAAYHAPQVRLLTLGWNPIYQNTPDALVAFSGLPAQGMSTHHILYTALPTKVFNAVYWYFTRATFQVSFPCAFFLFWPMLATVWRFLRQCAWKPWIRCATLLFLCGEFFRVTACYDAGGVDCVVTLAAVAMLVSMANVLYSQKGWGMLLVASFWMMASKQSALLSCFVFWVLFSFSLLWRYRAQWRRVCLKLFGAGLLLIAVLAWTSTAPYISSWVTMGHPLYPAYSGNPEAFPTRDITADFHHRNDDAKAMGHWGLLVNAYISSTLSNAYYKWTLGKDDFYPTCAVWYQRRQEENPDSPLFPSDRLLILSTLAMVLLWGNKPLRWLAGVMVAGVICFPTAYIGYMRYTPWFFLLWAIGLGSGLNRLQHCRRGQFIAYGLGYILGLYGLARASFSFCLQMDYADEVYRMLRSPGIKTIVVPDKNPNLVNNFHLICRQDERFAKCNILPPSAVEGESIRVAGLSSLQVVLNPGEEPPLATQTLNKLIPSRIDRYKRYITYIPWTFTVTFSRLTYARLRDLWQSLTTE